MKEFDKVIKGTLVLESIEFERVLYRKVTKANDRGSKVSIPKNLKLEGKYVYIVIPKRKK